MYDDITQRNAAGELELRTVTSTGDTNPNKNDVLTRDNEGKLAVRVVGNGGGGGGGGASTAADLSVNPAGMTVVKSTNAQGAFEELDEAAAQAINADSVLTTSVKLAPVMGQTVELLFDEMTGVPGRPDNKAVGAVVCGAEGYVGIISEVKDASVMVTTVYVPAAIGVVMELTTLEG